MKKQIIHIIPFAFLGGTEKDCLYIIEAGQEYKHKVIVLGTEGPMVNQWKEAGADVEILNILELPAKQFIEGLRNAVNKTKDCAGIMYWSTIKLPLVRNALKHIPARLVVHVGNPIAMSRLALLKFQISHRFFSSKIKTALFCCSDYVRQTCKTNPYFQKFEQRVSLNPVRLLPENPYHVRKLSSKDNPIIGMTARLDPIKDHATVIKAFALVLKEYPHARLWLMGDGVLRKQLEVVCSELNIQDAVVFHGNVPNVYDYLQQLDIFVYATTPAEGLGNSVSEALANGLPSVVSDLPMMCEIVGSDSAGLFAEPIGIEQFAEKILLLLSNHDLRRRLSDAAFSRATSTFSAKRYVEERMNYLIS